MLIVPRVDFCGLPVLLHELEILKVSRRHNIPLDQLIGKGHCGSNCPWRLSLHIVSDKSGRNYLSRWADPQITVPERTGVFESAPLGCQPKGRLST